MRQLLVTSATESGGKLWTNKNKGGFTSTRTSQIQCRQIKHRNSLCRVVNLLVLSLYLLFLRDLLLIRWRKFLNDQQSRVILGTWWYRGKTFITECFFSTQPAPMRIFLRVFSFPPEDTRYFARRKYQACIVVRIPCASLWYLQYHITGSNCKEYP
jgi:hypothetical protein